MSVSRSAAIASAAGSKLPRSPATRDSERNSNCAAWKQDLPGAESAATAGVGFSLQGMHLAGSLEIAKPLTHGDVEGKKNTALFAEASFKF